jgi:dihydroxyacetone kinase DhaKLM complex PTS-EIIA-like component DhaM
MLVSDIDRVIISHSANYANLVKEVAAGIPIEFTYASGRDDDW